MLKPTRIRTSNYLRNNWFIGVTLLMISFVCGGVVLCPVFWYLSIFWFIGCFYREWHFRSFRKRINRPITYFIALLLLFWPSVLPLLLHFDPGERFSGVLFRIAWGTGWVFALAVVVILSAFGHHPPRGRWIPFWYAFVSGPVVPILLHIVSENMRLVAGL